MMNHFCEASMVWQGLLLVLSLIAVITLIFSCVLSFRHRNNTRKQFGMGAVLLLNATLYVTMQVDSRITGAEHTLHLPYILAFAVTVVSLGFAVWSILRETSTRRIINNTSIREAFDNLPTGVCFFNEIGIPVLCNRVMHSFSFAVSGKDIQFVDDLQNCLSEDFIPIEGAEKSGKIFTLSDGCVWQLEKRNIVYEDGYVYTEYIALDVTQLQKNRIELQEENAQLYKVQAQLKQLSTNMVAVTREEEILHTKMSVHDEMGKCLLATQKYLKDDTAKHLPDAIVSSWKKAVSMLKYSNETKDDDMMLEIRKTCAFVNLDFVQTGQLPNNEKTAYLLTCAVRECVTNAVRYADATALYVDFSETLNAASVVITNNGKLPEGEIKEGGGLSTLRRRIEREGGSMVVQAQPCFRLTVTIPKYKEGVL